jgi:hypothetical protein
MTLEAIENRRSKWRVVGMVAAVIWFLLSLAAATALLIVAGFAASLGHEPIASHLRTAAWWESAAAVIAASGPFVIWLVRRRRIWLVMTVLLFAIPAFGAAMHFLASTDAPVWP